MKELIQKYKNISVQARASFWFLICGFFAKGISIITTPIFTRLLTTDEYGQFSVFSSWQGIVSVIVTLNLFAGVFTQGMVKNERRKREYASSLQGLCFTLCFAWTIIYLLFHDFWNDLFSLSTIQMLAMLVTIWTSAVFNFWSVSQRVDVKYRALVVITMIVTAAKPALGVFLVLHADDKVTARILGIVVVELIMYSWAFWFQMVQGRKFFSGEFWKHALIFNLPLIPHYLSMTVLNSSDRIMIQNLVGSGQAGIYSLAYSISQIMAIFNAALLQTIEPWLYQNIKAKRLDKMAKVAYPAIILIAILNPILMLFAPEVISIFAPAQYHEAKWVIPPVAMSVYFMFLYTFFAVFEFYFEKTKYIMAATTFGAVLNIVLNYIFIPIFGYFAAGYTTLVCYIIFALFHYHFMVKMCDRFLDGEKPYKPRHLLMITIIFMAASFVILLTYNHILVRYGMVVIGLLTAMWKRKQLIDTVKQLLQLKKKD